ncbi:hypothetical protein JG688_00016187 [Phytophthora aleatoria]|uniref:ATPase AAA-type core domain-containing protein n=1 Tax=Phytophthora aleatoria TaxID=2496075 RepID=A0A8J5I8T5_9STRA|nr:hypothetical protein JG688_00016187 [Phytophthora aleatoria]
MQSGGYEFSAAPRSVATKRNKSSAVPNGNANGNTERAQNIMFDKRVHRGSAYVMREETPESPGRRGGDPRKLNKAATRVARYHQQPLQQHQQQRPVTPPPVGGRFHMDVQTDNYLEELTDRNPEVDADTQTDALLDLHPPITFVPAPSGVDVATQIESGDLFDFDLEVEPILEVLVGKTLELGMLELLEEVELREIRQRQELFEQARNAELAEVQRLEAEAKRRFAEKQRRLDEETARLAAQAELEEKVAARASAKQYLASLHAQVFDTLVESGHFFDPLAKDVKQNFLPGLLESAAARAHQLDAGRKLLDAILVDAIRSRAATFRKIDKLINDAFAKYQLLELLKLANDKKRYMYVQAVREAKPSGEGDEEGGDKLTPVVLYKRYALSGEKSFKNLFFEEKPQLIQLLDSFMARSGKFAIKGFPYKLGLLLHGPPGTGKTSVIKAVAQYTKRHIVTTSLGKVKTNQELMNALFDLRFAVEGVDLP